MAKRVYKRAELTTEQNLERAEAMLFAARQRLVEAETRLTNGIAKPMSPEELANRDIASQDEWIARLAAKVEFQRGEVALNEANVASIRA